MQQLDPQVGWAMAERLAGDVAARTGAPAPQGVPPAAYLAAVMQERQAREARRAFSGGAVGGGRAAGGQVAGMPGMGGPVMPYGMPSPGPGYAASAYPPPPVSGFPPVSQQTAYPSAPHPSGTGPATSPGAEGAAVASAPVAPAPTPQDAGAERPTTGFAPPA